MAPGQDVPLIAMFHTLSRVKDFYLGKPDPNDSALRADGERCVITRADVVVGSTEDELHEMGRHYGRLPADYAVIPPGVDLDAFCPLDARESRRALDIDARRVILFVGREDRMKGLEVLLRSVAQLPSSVTSGLKVVLVGDRRRHDLRTSVPGPTPPARSLVSRLGLHDLVEIRGRVSQAELPLYYSAADVCAVPSAYESFGMAAIESMACQTPVVAFAVGGLATTIKDGQTGFLAAAGDNEAYAARLCAALTNHGLNAMGRQARLSVQRYTWDNVTRRTLELYESLLSRQAATSLQIAAGS
jgi:D-inositol-3-phosphate glycosyltransferase